MFIKLYPGSKKAFISDEMRPRLRANSLDLEKKTGEAQGSMKTLVLSLCRIVLSIAVFLNIQYKYTFNNE